MIRMRATWKKYIWTWIGSNKHRLIKKKAQPVELVGPFLLVQYLRIRVQQDHTLSLDSKRRV